MFNNDAYPNPALYAKLRADDPGRFMQVAAIFDNFGQTPMPITSSPHKARKTISHPSTLLTSPGKLKVVSTSITQGQCLQSARFVAGKNHLFTVMADGGLLKHTLKMSNLELQTDSRMKQGLYPRVGDVKKQALAVLSPDGAELYLVAIGGGIRCVNTTSGMERWTVLNEVNH